MSTTERHEAGSPPTLEATAAAVEVTIRQHPWIESLIRQGWFAKGAVYVLMGSAAVSIAMHHRAEQEASPEGALAMVTAQPGGRILLAIVAVGLVLYSMWRGISVLMITGAGPKAVMQRIGYAFSAVFYLVLFWAAASAVAGGGKPDDSRTVERLSAAALKHTGGRFVVVVSGFVVVGIGVYFVVKAVRRDFVDGLDGVSRHWAANAGRARLLFVGGIVGWLGRGVVTLLVGFFVARSAWRYDPNDARGFDRALRRVSDDPAGARLVLVAAIGLVVYGLYCLLSAPRRSIAKNPQ